MSSRDQKEKGRASPGARRARWASAALSSLALIAPRARAQTCFEENECTFEKPNVLVVMDYSSSMAQENFGAVTRWEAQVDAVRRLADTSEFMSDMHVALARFGYDPDPASGTTLAGDQSTPPLVDGFAVDIPWTSTTGGYTECNAAGLRSVLDALPPPPTGRNLIGTWTRGALESALDLIQSTRAAHPADENRVYDVVLMTDGDWNCQDSFDQSSCDGDPAGEPNDFPGPAAAALAAAGVRVHVVAFGDGTTSADLDAIAQAGGTGTALDASSPDEIAGALGGVLREVRDAVVVPECIGGLPRVMIIMDASPSMIVGAGIGDSNWDKARYALAGNPAAPNPGDPGYVQPLFDRTVQAGGHTVSIEDVVHIGLLAFNARDVQELMLQYAPCARDNIQWAMDPYTSCVYPGCTEPYTDPDTSLVFTSLVSDTARNPPFVQTTRSFMPPCNPGGPARCMGLVFSTYTGEGANAARVNLARYAADSGAFRLDPDTPFVNVLVTDGQTSPDDPMDAAAVLADMRLSGVPTWVIGFGSPSVLDVAQLDAYAVAGGTGGAFVVDPAQGDSADALADRIAQVIAGIRIDPCCQLNDCSENPEPALPYCGNGTLETGEVCDEGDANGVLGGTCAHSCARTTFCGDGIVTPAESCDDANTDDTDGCTAECRLPGENTGGTSGGTGTGATGNGASPGSGGSGSGSGGTNGGTGTGATGSGAGSTGSGAGSTGSGSGSGAGANGSGDEVDGGSSGDGGDGEGARGGANSSDSGACGCRMTTERTPSTVLALIVALGVVSGARRRVRRRIVLDGSTQSVALSTSARTRLISS